jgi:hypothetical protein
VDPSDRIVRAHRAYNYAVIAALYFAPMAWFIHLLWHEEHPVLTLVTVLMMPVCLLATKLPKAWFRPRDWEMSGTFYRRLGVPFFGRFVMSGDWMNKRIRRVQPGQRLFLNAAARCTLRARTQSGEVGHWIWLLASIPPLIFGVVTRRYGFVATVLIGTVIVNVYPIALQRCLRARLAALDHPDRTTTTS